MNMFSSRLTFLFWAFAPDLPSPSELRWQFAGMAIGVVVLSIGLGGLSLFFFRSRARDRSLVFFSLFSLLYAVRLIFRQSIMRSVVAASSNFWNYFDLVIDCVIVIPLTLFLIETVQPRWKTILRWLLAFQVAFESARFLSHLLRVGRQPMQTAHSIVIVVFSALLAVYPFSFGRRKFPREFKVVYAGLLVFGLFVVHDNLVDLGVLRGRSVEPIGFLIFVCCLGYLAAFRTFANEERLFSIQKELEIARQIQSSILPREIPRIAGLDIAARYVPMTAVAGDFYDFIVVDARRVGILVADVTGHGVPAALIASMLKVALAAQSGHARDPGQVLAGLNDSLCGKFDAHFVTAGYLFLDAEKRVLRYAGAGHPPLLLGSVDGGKKGIFREIESNGLLLGLSAEATYSAVEHPFRPGDRCLLYTDGVLDARNAARQEFGSSRLLQFLEAQSNLAAAPLATEFLNELARWSGRAHGRAQEDDITLIAVDFEGFHFPQAKH